MKTCAGRKARDKTDPPDRDGKWILKRAEGRVSKARPSAFYFQKFKMVFICENRENRIGDKNLSIDSAGQTVYDILIVGGEDHQTGQETNAGQRFSRLESWTGTRFPMIEGVEFRWPGQVTEPFDES